MRLAPSSRLVHVFRIATLVVPSWLAWAVAFTHRGGGVLVDVVKTALVPVWLLVVIGLLVRTSAIAFGRDQSEGSSRFGEVDVLTSAGAALGWTSAFAIMGAVWLGWASLAVVGMLGTGLFHAVVLYAFVALGGGDPLRRGSITRSFSPRTVTEGDAVIEEVRFSGVRIPVGYRLFASGRIGHRWATSRHVLESADSHGDVVLESDVGPAVRGDHDAEPLVVWLQDSFGLCRSPRVLTASARLTVLPSVRDTSSTKPLLAHGDGPHAPRATMRLPTEGQFDLREYREGDDVRRIHWVRSLASNQIVVRMPDEIPPDRPNVRLVLDTYFPEVEDVASEAPAQMLDALVMVWLSVAQSLAASGARVTLLAVVPHADGSPRVARQDFSPRAMDAARHLGARAVWQGAITADAMFTDDPTFVVARGVIARPHGHLPARWILVHATPAASDTWKLPSIVRYPLPMGSTENRWSVRRREEKRRVLSRRDHGATFRAVSAQPPPGSYVVAPASEGALRLEPLTETRRTG